MAAGDTVDPTGQAITFEIVSEDLGTLWRNGVRINLNDPPQRTIGFGQSITWRRPAGSSGVLGAFRVKLVGDGAPASVVSIRLGPPTGLNAVNDQQLVQLNSAEVLVETLGNDSGVGLQVMDVGVALHGQVTLTDSGQLRYTPAVGYLGPDGFSYRVSDGVNNDLAYVSLEVVNYDPSAGGSFAGSFQATRLQPLPGWVGLPQEWDWGYRDSLPDWAESWAVD